MKTTKELREQKKHDQAAVVVSITITVVLVIAAILLQ